MRKKHSLASVTSMRPKSFRSRTLRIILAASVIACMAAAAMGYAVVRYNIRSEMMDSQRTIAIYLLELNKKTDLSMDEMIRMAETEDMAIDHGKEYGDITLSLRRQLEDSAISAVTGNIFDTPITYVQLSEGILCIHPVHNYNLFVIVSLRVVYIIIICFGVLVLMSTTASKYIAKPVTDMTGAIHRLKDGDFSVRLPESDTDDEVSEMVHAFNSMTDALGKNAYLQQDFISGISHEFRTPIASIRGFAKLLSMPGLTDEQRKEYTEMIVQESERLAQLSNALLRLTALEQQVSPASVTSFSMDEQVRQIILSMEPLWSQKNIEWTLELEPVTIKSDQDLLAQVWTNLIQNALKFSPDNSEIIIRTNKHETAEFVITDHGIGMDDATLVRIFDRFYQADSSHASQGVGLGLSLVKRILDILGGTITVTSQPGKGSTFTVHLPPEPILTKEGTTE